MDDWMRQRKKKILHKLCIDMERSEYTSFSMLAALKYGSAQRCSIFFSASAIQSAYLHYSGGICSINPDLIFSALLPQQIIDKLLCRPSRQSAMRQFPFVCLKQQLFFRHVDAAPLCQDFHDLLEFFLLG